MADFRLGAARDLPIREGTYDGPAAAGRMLDAAGIGSDNPDLTAARRGFLIYDAEAPELRGSYHLPFADLVNGTLTAIGNGVRNASSRLPQMNGVDPDLQSRAQAVIDAYLERLRNQQNAARPAHNRAYSLIEVKSLNDGERIIEGIASTPSVDRMGDIVEPMGAKFTLPMPLLWQHQADKPVGMVEFAKANAGGINIRATIAKITDPGTLKDRVDEAWQSLRAGLVRGLSIGFTPIGDNGYEFMDGGGIRFSQWDWLELSLVTIPANAEATIQTIKSIDAGLRAASGIKPARTLSAGVSASSKSIPRPKEARQMPKTYGEQIAAFEATRAAKNARMDELMNAAGERGATLDTAEQEEYDELDAELKSIDGHLVRLREREKASAAAAVPAVGATEKEGSEARQGVRVTAMKRNLPPGIPFTRYCLALAISKGNLTQAVEIARGNKAWREDTPEVETVLRAAVAAGTTTDSTWAGPLVEYQIMASEFIEYMRPRTIVGRIPGLRQVPFKIKVPRQTAVASVGWVGETKPKPISSQAFDSVTLDFAKIAGIVIISMELARLSNPAAEMLVREDLAAGITQLLDQDFVDVDKAAVANVSPASVTYGVTPVTATGTAYANFVADLKSVMQNFLDVNILPSAILMRQDLALALSLMVTSLGNPQFPGLTMDGGTLAGLPVITSQNIPYTEDSPQEGSPIIFLSANDIMLADDGQVMIDVSTEAAVQMDSAPDDPTSASTVLVSLWQRNLVGIRAERMINWAKRRPQSVQLISAAKYA